jgi:hypothetical protein
VRVAFVTLLLAGGVAASLILVVPAPAEPETCPAVCDQIPNSAWIQQRAVPLNSAYNWPPLAGVAVSLTGSGTAPRFRFEELCGAQPPAQDPRASAVVARATVVHPDGQWQLQAQIVHWRGDTMRGGVMAASVFGNAVAVLRGCQQGAPSQSPSVTTDEQTRMAAVISGPVIMHTYLVAHVASSTISELTLWSTAPPQIPWPSMADAPQLDSMTAPLCEAYIASCP